MVNIYISIYYIHPGDVTLLNITPNAPPPVSPPYTTSRPPNPYLLQQLHVLEDPLVGIGVDLSDLTADRLRSDAGQRLDPILGTVERSNVHQRGHRLGSRRRDTHGVQPAGEQARLDLHEAAIDLAHHNVAFLEEFRRQEGVL